MKYLFSIGLAVGVIAFSNAQNNIGFTSVHTIQFTTKSITLTSKAKRNLEGWIKRLKKGAVYEVMIFGYGDAHTQGKLRDYLSQRRAETVVNYLRNRGIPEQFMRVVPTQKQDHKTKQKQQQVELFITPKLDILDPRGR